MSCFNTTLTYTRAAVFAAVVSAPVVGVAAPNLEGLGNIAYSGIHDEPIRLVNGLYEGEPFVAGGAARPRVQLLGDLFVTDDIDGDGSEDAYVLLSESSGGSGNDLYLAAVTHPDGTANNIATLRIGDRVDVMTLETSDGKATLEYVATGPGEAACCPTFRVSGVYGLKDGKLTELSREERGTLSIEQLAGSPWRLVQFGRSQPVPEGVSITAEFEGERISGSAGCNNYFATVKAPTPYEFSIGPVGATRMACPPPQLEAENRFLKALEKTMQFSFVLGKLAIDYQSNNTYSTLVFERNDPD